MNIKSKNIQKLLEAYREIYTLNRISATLSWDTNVNLPDKAIEERAGQSAYLAGKITDLWLNPQFKALLELASSQKGLNKYEKAIIRNLRHSGKYYFSVPKEIVIEFEEATSKAFVAWRQARKNNDFDAFLPALKKNIKLNQIIAKHLGYADNPYDALLDMYEPNLTTKQCDAIFTKLATELVPFIVKIKKSKVYKRQQKDKDSKLYPQKDQQKLALFVLKKIGYELDRGRMDISAHPFTTTLGQHDIRITNRYKETNYIESIMVALHEGGHGLYELGVDEQYAQTPLEGGVSLGIHESQSRFWENQLGRSKEFVEFIIPILQATYPDQLGGTNTELIYTDFNRVDPSLIRVEADEVTYNLHIALRFELEEALINNKLKPEDLPQIWNKKMKKYFGIVPDSNATGVLQDVHWSYGNFGYFPTYTLGNLYAAQFAAKLHKELDLEKLVGVGEFGSILSWFKENVHRHGSLYWPDELVRNVTNKSLKPEYFIEYLKGKYGQIYNL